jgi:hypothetical protein
VAVDLDCEVLSAVRADCSEPAGNGLHPQIIPV